MVKLSMPPNTFCWNLSQLYPMLGVSSVSYYVKTVDDIITSYVYFWGEYICSINISKLVNQQSRANS